MDIGAVFSLGPLQTALLQTFVCVTLVNICRPFSWVCRIDHRIGGLQGRCMSSFSGSCQIDLQRGRTVWHSQQAVGVPVAPNLRQHLMVSVLLIFIVLVDVQWNTMCLICISLVTNEFAHLFLYPLIIRRSAVVKGMFTHFCLFFYWLLVPFLLWI